VIIDSLPHLSLAFHSHYDVHAVSHNPLMQCYHGSVKLSHSSLLQTAVLLTFLDGSSTTCFSQTIALSDRAAETDVHKPLSVGRQWRSTGQHHANSSTEQLPDLLEDDPVQMTPPDCAVWTTKIMSTAEKALQLHCQKHQ